MNESLDPETRELAAMIETSTQRAKQLVEDLMAFGRRDLRRPCVLDLATAAAKADGKGTGLGLSIVKQIVERSGSFVHVDSEPGVGSVFRAFIPMIAGA